jgi:DNA-binding CsgD family transcriptional regulator
LKEERFAERDRRLLRLFHQELGPLIGVALAGTWEPNLAGLSPRQRQTLEALLEGDSEKQIASRLGLSGETIHDYVKGLHRYFGVCSRGELLALFLRRFRTRPAPESR